jgi:hypothetical protein
MKTNYLIWGCVTAIAVIAWGMYYSTIQVPTETIDATAQSIVWTNVDDEKNMEDLLKWATLEAKAQSYNPWKTSNTQLEKLSENPGIVYNKIKKNTCETQQNCSWWELVIDTSLYSLNIWENDIEIVWLATWGVKIDCECKWSGRCNLIHVSNNQQTSVTCQSAWGCTECEMKETYVGMKTNVWYNSLRE